ncbi:MAG: hypothetical protein KAX20_03475 [Candidatus Omnitrophica bacterium]|nr:hypothetical protein [Candidatus Omnitrophota bacterium]
MTRKEKVYSAIQHKETVSLPYYLDFTPPVTKLLQKHCRNEDVNEAIGNHLLSISAKRLRPLYADPKIYGEYSRDEFGVLWHNDEDNRGHVVEYPLKDLNLKGDTFPNPRESSRFAHLPSLLKKEKKVFVLAWVGDFWERATFMCPPEELLTALYLKPSFVEELLDKIASYNLATAKELISYGVDGLCLSDDYGTQKALLMSPKQWRHFIKPHLAELFSFAHGHNLFTLLHSDGNIREIIPDLIEIGLDVLNPVQPESMDPYGIKREFGKELCLWGAIGTQQLLNKATVPQIRREVKRAKDILGRGGGYILGPGITVQKDCPLENILALIDVAKEKR